MADADGSRRDRRRGAGRGRSERTAGHPSGTAGAGHPPAATNPGHPSGTADAGHPLAAPNPGHASGAPEVGHPSGTAAGGHPTPPIETGRPSRHAADLVAGLHAATALLRDHPERAELLLVQRGRRDARIGAVMDLARAAGVRMQIHPRQALDRLHSGAHQGVVVRVRGGARSRGQNELEQWLESASAPLLLVLDGIEDPRNLGACLRTADAAGADAVVVPRSRTASLGAAARKTASGAFESIPVYEVPNLARALQMLAEFNIRRIGASDDAPVSWTQADYRGAVAIVLGGEARGLRRLTRQACDELVAIPMRGSVSSLNVSVAGGVLLFEALRQRLATQDGNP